MTATVRALPSLDRLQWKQRVSFRLGLDDLRFSLAEKHAESHRFAMAPRFNQLAALGLAVEASYVGKHLPRPLLMTTARAGLGMPLQRFKTTLPPELFDDFHAWKAARNTPYAARFIRLVEVGLLHEQELATAPAFASKAPAARLHSVQESTTSVAAATPPRNQARAEDVLQGLHAALEAEW